jgi:hypothetical protein
MMKNTTCIMWDWHAARERCILRVLVEKTLAPAPCENLKWEKRYINFKQTYTLYFSIMLLNVLSAFLSWTCFRSSFDSS